MKNFILVIVLLAFIQVSKAQVKTNFGSRERISEQGKFLKNFPVKIHRTLPAKDINVLLKKEESEKVAGEAKPFRIAEAVPVDIDVAREADWLDDQGFSYCKFALVASGAKSISVNFDKFYLPKGSELWTYSDKGEMITGPITETENNENKIWGTWVYKGEKMNIDLKLPSNEKNNLVLHISNIAHGYKEIYNKAQVNDFNNSDQNCEVNVLCPLGNGWENERNSVALILNGNGSALCSGALINNACSLTIAYFLTANHCFQASNDVANWRFTFQAWSPICVPSQNANGIIFNGSTLRANSAGSDFCLLELAQMPPANSGITFSGWSRNTNGVLQTTIIHHPAGDVMKISRDIDPPAFQTFNNAQCWQLVLDQGATEGGSSGAPYYDQNHRIIAQHFGINQVNLPVCQQVNKFGGRFDISWTGGGTKSTRLSDWLDPFNSGTMATNTINIANTVADYRNVGVSGPSLVCTTGQYSPTNLPAGIGLAWSSSNPSGLSINPSTGVATRVNNFNGQVTVTATVSGGGCNASVQQTVWVGNPPANIGTLIYPSGSRGIDPVTLGPASTYQFQGDYVPQATSFRWLLPPGFSFYSGNTTSSPFITTSATVGSYILYCAAANACGQSWTHSLGITISTGGGGCCPAAAVRLSAFPNPASSTMTVQLIDSLATGESQTPDQPYRLTLVDRLGTPVFSAQPSGHSVQVPVSQLPAGVYYLNVVYKGAVLQRQVFIVH